MVSIDIPFLESFFPFLRTTFVLIFSFIAFTFLLNVVKRALLTRVHTKRQISNVQIFSRILNYVFLLLLIIFAVLSYAGSWTGLGLSLGLFSAALGWALQKPITGIAGWIMVVTKRPFDIGDRIIIGAVRGDVLDITLTHIYLSEIGGTIASEENSGRIILVPNSTLFETTIINYTSRDEYVLDQVVVNVTFESNIRRVIDFAMDAARKHAYSDKGSKRQPEPYVRTYFQPNGMAVHIRYFSPAKRLQEISSLVTMDIFDNIVKAKDVELAYPHTKLVFGETGRSSLENLSGLSKDSLAGLAARIAGAGGKGRSVHKGRKLK